MSAITWHCSTYKHAHLVQFKGTPEEEQLALDCHEFLHTIDAALQNVLTLTAPPQTVSLMDAMPVVSLYFNSSSHSDRNPVAEADRPRMLQAFARLAQFSSKLNACPPVKTVFWFTVATTLCGPEVKNLHKQFLGLPQFPQFGVNCGRQRYPPWSTVNESLCDALYDFLTTPVEEASSSAPLPLGLSFAYEEPTLDRTREQLKLIERMLDRASTSPTLQYKLTMLDFTNTIMNALELEIVARIVAKCKSGFYQIEQLKLDAVIPNIGMSGYTPGDTPREFRDIASTAFSPDGLPPFWSFEPRVELPVRDDAAPSVLRKISLDKNVLTDIFYPQHFSTLRYGCPLEQDLSDYSIGTRYKEDISIDCWRWLAFGLFYPRPKRFAQAYKLHTIGKLTIDPIAIRTIVNTVRNPVAQLVHNDLEGADTTSPDCLMVCTVKEGASIEVFVSGMVHEVFSDPRNAIEPWHKDLLETSEFEALCEREDGSVCVVMPGAGLGWVSKEDVVLLEREPLDLARSAQDGWYHATIGPGQVKTHVTELQPLFNAIGHQLRSQTVEYNLHVRGIYGAYQLENNTPVQQTVVQFIRDHCVHLRHLFLVGPTSDDLSDLLAALSNSDLGSRLLTLNLSDYPVDDSVVVRLASILASTEHAPALRELRMTHYGITLEGLSSIHDALAANYNLALLELRRTMAYASDAERRSLQDRLEASYQGAILPRISSVDEDVSELSDLTRTRRTIAWNEDFRTFF